MTLYIVTTQVDEEGIRPDKIVGYYSAHSPYQVVSYMWGKGIRPYYHFNIREVVAENAGGCGHEIYGKLIILVESCGDIEARIEDKINVVDKVRAKLVNSGLTREELQIYLDTLE